MQREPRAIDIFNFSLTRDEIMQQDLHFRVSCSKGTYVRSLVYDLVSSSQLLIVHLQNGMVSMMQLGPASKLRGWCPEVQLCEITSAVLRGISFRCPLARL